VPSGLLTQLGFSGVAIGPDAPGGSEHCFGVPSILNPQEYANWFGKKTKSNAVVATSSVFFLILITLEFKTKNLK
jgi:hypothetical protein